VGFPGQRSASACPQRLSLSRTRTHTHTHTHTHNPPSLSALFRPYLPPFSTRPCLPIPARHPFPPVLCRPCPSSRCRQPSSPWGGWTCACDCFQTGQAVCWLTWSYFGVERGSAVMTGWSDWPKGGEKKCLIIPASLSSPPLLLASCVPHHQHNMT